MSDLLYEMQWRTDISHLANQARFGFGYFMKSNKKDMAPRFLRKGLSLIISSILRGLLLYMK